MLRKYLPEIFFIFAVTCNSVIKTEDVKIILQSPAGNISSVNKALYDFINKYDQILKVLKSKEDEQKDSISISNNDDTEESYEKRNETQKNWLPPKVDYIRASTFKPVTAAIYDSESLDDDDITDYKQVTNTALNKTKEPVDNSNIQNNSLEYAQDDTDNYSSEDNESDIQVISIDMPPKTNSNQNKITTKNKKKAMTSKKPRVFQNILGKKTRFSVQRLSSRQTRKNYSQPQFQFRAPVARDNSRRIKRIIYSETFSPNNIWQEIISRPIKLTNDEDPFFKSQKPKREETDKITIVILPKQEMDDNNTFEESVKLAKDGKLEPNEYQFRNHEKIVFRSTYGDTCLQIPIKKCVKAIKEVNKKVCKLRFKCKGDFKSAFIRNGKKECKKQFDITKISMESKTNLRGQQNIYPLNLRKHKYNDSSIGVTKDLLPEKHYDFIIYTNNKTLMSVSSPKSNLRDKYEIACQKSSRSKCIQACNNTTKKTCAEITCEKNKKKAFDKSCKEECKKLFIVNRGKDSGEDSSDSDSSDSDSD